MDLPELSKRLFTLGEEPEPVKSISYHTDDTKLFTAIRGALHPDEYQELKDSKLGVFFKFKELNFAWASRLVHFMLCFKLDIKKKYELWCLVGPQPARFSLIEFEHLTGLNCNYVENLENPRWRRRLLSGSFWVLMRLGYLAIFTGLIEGRKFSTVTRASLARLVMDLEEFENYPWGRVAFKVLMDSLWNKDLTKSYTIDGFVQVIQVWVYYALPEFGAEYSHPVQNKLRLTRRLNYKSSHQTTYRRLNYKSYVSRLVRRLIVKSSVASATLGSNQKSVVVYAKNEEGYVKEETTVKEERPRKKARKETTVKIEESPREAEETPREAEETPREAGEAPLGWIT
ncbi:hypothetical protein N665_0302s0012 [Sinapis alba]|nr:hypothetical protein N665_0302s0012 [Sinapis alba]